MIQQGISQEVYCHRYIYDSEVFHITALNVLQTVLDITGRGQATILMKIDPGDSHYLQLTVDGNVIVANRPINFQNLSQHIGVYNFQHSLLVEHRNAGGAVDTQILVSYCVN